MTTLEKRTNYTPIFIEEYKKCKKNLDCKKFDIYVRRDIDTDSIERNFIKSAKENNLTLKIYYNKHSNNDIYEFSFE